MRTEGLLYALAFAAILAVGAALIVPRLRPAGSPDAQRSDPPSDAGARPAPFEPSEPAPWPARQIRVVGERGALRGPLRTIVGADVQVLKDSETLRPRLRVQPRAAWIEVGAAGHRWVRVAAADLTEGQEIELPEAAAALVVRVREADGSPAADVPLRVRPAAPGAEPRTDEGGTLVLDYLPPGKVIVDGNTAERAGQVLHLVAGVDHDVRLLLDPVWEIHGRVHTASDRSVAGARVEVAGPVGAWGRAVHTDAQGAFRWRGPLATRVALRVLAPGHGEWSQEVEPPLRGALRSDVGVISLGVQGVRLEGRVRPAHAGVVARVRIEPAVASLVRELFGPAFVFHPGVEAEVSDEGLFVVDDLPARIPLRVSVRGAGAALDVLARGEPGERVRLDLEPPDGDTLSGSLRRPDGTPAAGTALLVSDAPRDGDLALDDDRVVFADREGAFRLRGIATRVVFVRAYAPGCRSLLQRVVLPLAAPLDLRFTPALTDAGRRVSGTIVDEKGVPLVGVTVRAGGVHGATDEQGRFVLEGVESLAPEVAVSYGYEPGTGGPGTAEFERVETTSTRPGAPALLLVLPRTARLRLRLVDGLSGEPIDWAHLVVRMRLGERILLDRGLATHAGIVELTGLPPGLVEVSAFAPGLRAERLLTLASGAARELEELRMVSAGYVEGEVLDAGGRAISAAHVAVLGPSWQTRSVEVARDRDALLRRTQTDANGRFRMEGLKPDAPMEIVVWAPNHAPASVRAESTQVDGRTRGWASVRLVPGVFMALELEDGARGGRVHGALAELESAQGSDYLELLHRGMLGSTVGSSEDWKLASEHLLFEERGYEGYLLGPLAAGPYDLTVECPGFAPLRQKVTLIDPEQSVLYDLTAGEDRRYGLRITRFVFSMKPDS